MAVTTQQIIALERPLPEEQRFSAAALTQQLYTGIKGTLDKSKNDTTSNIYGPMERWNPELVLNSLTNYSGTITDYSGRREEIEAHDPLLGPVLTNYVAGRSAHLTTLKNAALPWLNYIKDRAAFTMAHLQLQEEQIRQQREVAQASIPTLEGYLQRLNEIGA